jgi:prephenate dehydratase
VSLLGPPSRTPDNHQPYARKASIALALRNVHGAIFKMSSCFAFRNVDINKIESRPASVAMQLLPTLSTEARAFTQRHWDLIFYIDYEPSLDEEVNAAMMRNLEEYCVWIRELGAYQAGLACVDSMPSDWSQMVDVLCH